MLRGQVGGLVGGLRGVGIFVAFPCSIFQNLDYPSQLLKIVINHKIQIFFILGEKLQLELKINHRVTVSPKKCKPVTVQNAAHFSLSLEG